MNPRPSIQIRHFAKENLTLHITSAIEPLIEVLAEYIALHYQAEFNDRLNALEEGYPSAIQERLGELFKPLVDRIGQLEERVRALEQQFDRQESYDLEMRDHGE